MSAKPESRIVELRSPDQLKAGYPVLAELRIGLSARDFLSLYRKSRAADGYTLAGAFDGKRCVAVMGYRILHDYVHGKHLYIDDLVTTAEARGRGLGAKMLKYAEKQAAVKGCARLRLCTGSRNAAAKRFYAREGWKQSSVVFKKQPA